MPDQNYNPIKKLRAVGASTWTTTIPCPSSYKWDMEDVSASNAGRTEDVQMHKYRIGQVVALELSWQNVPTATVASVLQMFQPEYLEVEYLDAFNGAYKTSIFYVGNRSAPAYSTKLGLWQNVTFKIIERDGAMKTIPSS